LDAWDEELARSWVVVSRAGSSAIDLERVTTLTGGHRVLAAIDEVPVGEDLNWLLRFCRRRDAGLFHETHMGGFPGRLSAKP
jgi:hypothetical protein